MRKAFAIALIATVTSACTTAGPVGFANGNEIILLGDSHTTGDDAVAMANLRLKNAQAAGCYGIAVGGYAVSTPEQGGIVYGIPFMVRCPPGLKLIPNGTPTP
jgi:hypothetical protein